MNCKNSSPHYLIHSLNLLNIPYSSSNICVPIKELSSFLSSHGHRATSPFTNIEYIGTHCTTSNNMLMRESTSSYSTYSADQFPHPPSLSKAAALEEGHYQPSFIVGNTSFANGWRTDGRSLLLIVSIRTIHALIFT